MFSEWNQIEDQLKDVGMDAGEFKNELIRGWELDRNMAELRQRQVAGRLNTQPHYHLDGMGECVARIDLGAYFYWAMREGYECWNDKGFMREYLRDNPEVRVKSQARQTTVLRP